MNSTKKLMLTEYSVKYVYLREPKPRKHHTATVIYDGKAIAATEALGLCFTDLIKERFGRYGYYVLTIHKIKRIPAMIDLKKAYERTILAEKGGF